MPPKTIRFSDEMTARVQKFADLNDRSFSYVVQRAVQAWLAAQEHSPFSVSGNIARRQALEKVLSDCDEEPLGSAVAPSRVEAAPSRTPVEKKPEVSSQSSLTPKAAPASSRQAPSIRDTWAR